jgi:hypothetical protein
VRADGHVVSYPFIERTVKEISFMSAPLGRGGSGWRWGELPLIKRTVKETSSVSALLRRNGSG